MRYYYTTGTVEDAISFMNRSDQLFESRDGTVTVKRFSPQQEVYTFFPDDNIADEINAFCEDAKLQANQPHGRLCRLFLKDIIGLDASKQCPGWHIRDYAAAETQEECIRFNKPVSGHWNYYYFKPMSEPQLCFDLDATSAYLRSLFMLKSFYFKEPYDWHSNPEYRHLGSEVFGKRYVGTHLDDYVDDLIYNNRYQPYAVRDRGALERLKEWESRLPKVLRLRLLGIIGSRELKWREKDDSGRLVIKTKSKIDYGWAFNAVQVAVLRWHKIMNQLVEIAKPYCYRAHTDDLVVDAAMLPHIETKLFDYAQECGAVLRPKAVGVSYFWSNNSGYVGKFGFKGVSSEIKMQMQAYGQKFDRPDMTPEVWERWKHRLLMYEWQGANGSIRGWLEPRWIYCDQTKRIIKNGGIFWAEHKLLGGTSYSVEVTQSQINKGIRKI